MLAGGERGGLKGDAAAKCAEEDLPDYAEITLGGVKGDAAAKCAEDLPDYAEITL